MTDSLTVQGINGLHSFFDIQLYQKLLGTRLTSEQYSFLSLLLKDIKMAIPWELLLYRHLRDDECFPCPLIEFKPQNLLKMANFQLPRDESLELIRDAIEVLNSISYNLTYKRITKNDKGGPLLNKKGEFEQLSLHTNSNFLHVQYAYDVESESDIEPSNWESVALVTRSAVSFHGDDYYLSLKDELLSLISSYRDKPFFSLLQYLIYILFVEYSVLSICDEYSHLQSVDLDSLQVIEFAGIPIASEEEETHAIELVNQALDVCIQLKLIQSSEYTPEEISHHIVFQEIDHYIDLDSDFFQATLSFQEGRPYAAINMEQLSSRLGFSTSL